MDRRGFFRLIEREFLTIEEGHNLATEEFTNFDLASTELVQLMMADKTRREMFDFFVYEKEKDNWCFMCEEFASCFLQVLSTVKISSDLSRVPIDYLESIYYEFIEGLLEITAGVQFDMDKMTKVYVEHLMAIKSLLDPHMDIEELRTDKA